MSPVFQVDASASSLNSNDAFLLKTADGRSYLWMGKGASEEEQKGAEYMSRELNCSSKHTMEGKEPGHHLHFSYIKMMCCLSISTHIPYAEGGV